MVFYCFGFPTAWALWIVSKGALSYKLISLFFMGTLIMRSAGCILNDIADKKFDIYVERTKNRPLTSGEITTKQAITLCLLLLLSALWIVLQLPLICFFYACIALLITFIYPFCKRFIEAPQCILGFAFSMGIPIAVFALHGSFNVPIVLLFILNFAWIVAYDTQYALMDREDDLKIGIKSTAILFGHHERIIICMLQIFFHGVFIYIGLYLNYTFLFYFFWACATLVLIYQHHLLNNKNYSVAFNSNIFYGGLMWLAICFGQ